MLARVFGRHGREFARAIQRREWWRTPSGIHFPRQHATLAGAFAWQAGETHGCVRNLLTDNALALIGSEPLPTGGGGNHPIYEAISVCLWGANVFPDAAWSAEYLALVAGEYGDGPEGYTEVVRPAWTPADEGSAVGNTASPAVFTIATASSLPVYGFALCCVTNVKRAGLASVTPFDPTTVTSSSLSTDEDTVFGRHRVEMLNDWYDPSNDDGFDALGGHWVDPSLDDITISGFNQNLFALARVDSAPLLYTNGQVVNVTYVLTLE